MSAVSIIGYVKHVTINGDFVWSKLLCFLFHDDVFKLLHLTLCDAIIW